MSQSAAGTASGLNGPQRRWISWRNRSAAITRTHAGNGERRLWWYAKSARDAARAVRVNPAVYGSLCVELTFLQVGTVATSVMV
jgi:hypothetical protein